MKFFDNMNTRLKFMALGFGLSLLVSCDDNLFEKPEADDTFVGITLVDLDANKVVVRGEEALLGNVVTDAMLYYAIQNNIDVDVALANGGGIRFFSDSHVEHVGWRSRLRQGWTRRSYFTRFVSDSRCNVHGHGCQ